MEIIAASGGLETWMSPIIRYFLRLELISAASAALVSGLVLGLAGLYVKLSKSGQLVPQVPQGRGAPRL